MARLLRDCAHFTTHRQVARDIAGSPVIVPLIINPKRQKGDCWHRLNASLWFAAVTEDCYVPKQRAKKKKTHKKRTPFLTEHENYHITELFWVFPFIINKR